VKSTVSNFMKIRPGGIEFFHADRQTDRQADEHDEVNCRFFHFASAPQNDCRLYI